MSRGAKYSSFLSAPVYDGITSVIVSTVPSTAETVDKVLQYKDIQACCVVLSILIDIWKDLAYLVSVKGLKFVMYGKGPYLDMLATLFVKE